MFPLRKVLALLLVLTALARAQSPYVAEASGLLVEKRYPEFIAMVTRDPAAAEAAVRELVDLYPDLDQSRRASAFSLANYLARTLEARLGRPAASQYLARFSLLGDPREWEGETLFAFRGPRPSWDPEELALFLLRRGDYPDAHRVLLVMLADPANSARRQRLQRYEAAALLELGWCTQALKQLEELRPADLQLELLTIQACIQTNQVQKARGHIQSAEKLVATASPVYGQVARYLLETWSFLLDIQKNPRMPIDEVRRRHDAAWAHLRNLSGTGWDQLLTELSWVGETAWTIWFKKVLARDPNAEDWLTLHSQELVRLGETEISNDAVMAYYSLRESFLLEMQRTRDPYWLARTDKLLTGYESLLPDLHGRIREEFAEASVAYRPFLDQAHLDLSPYRGACGRILGYLNLLRARQLLATAGDPARISRELDAAERYGRESDSSGLQGTTVVVRTDALEQFRPPGWEAQAQTLLDQTLADPRIREIPLNQVALLYQMARLRMAQGRYREVVEVARPAIEVMEELVREVGGDADSARFIRYSYAVKLYELVARAQLLLGQNAQAFETIGTAQQMDAVGVFDRSDLQSRVSAGDQKLVEQADQNGATLEARARELRNLVDARGSTEQVRQASIELDKSRQAYASAVGALETRYPSFNRLKVKPVSFPALQKHIPADTVVVLLFPTEERLYLLVATREALVVRESPVGQARLEELATAFRREVGRYSRDIAPFSWSGPEAQPLSENLGALYGFIVKPIEAELAGKSAVAFVPYGNLAYIPFQALRNEQGFLIEQKQMAVIHRAADLDQVFGAPSPTTGKLVAFGNPDGTLASAGQEVQALAALYPDANIYLEKSATRDKLDGVKAPAVSFLHFATHGELDPSNPRASFLVLAGGGKLSLGDIIGIDFKSGQEDMCLATLSACQTALAGRGVPDGAELRTLADAFRYAGCRSVVASLWRVDDDSTRDLMVELYRGLKAGKSKAAALQEAQVKLLHTARYAHPFYWAPFVLIGDWR